MASWNKLVCVCGFLFCLFVYVKEDVTSPWPVVVSQIAMHESFKNQSSESKLLNELVEHSLTDQCESVPSNRRSVKSKTDWKYVHNFI